MFTIVATPQLLVDSPRTVSGRAGEIEPSLASLSTHG